MLQEEGQTQVVHRNFLMHVAPPHQQAKIEPDSNDSEYDTPPGDVWLPGPISSSTGPVTQSQMRAHQLAQSI